MIFVTAVILLLIVFLALSYFHAPLWSFTGTALAVLAVSTKCLCLPLPLLVFLWLLFLSIALSLHIPLLRRRLFSDRIFQIFRKLMPPISKTEQEALEAGTVWWDGELFSGRPDWKKLRDLPAPSLTKDEQAFIDGPVEELCAMLNDWEITQELDDLPSEVWDFIKEKGFFGMIIPVKYGGLDISALAHSTVIMKIASRSISAAVTIMVPNSLGPAKLLLDYGTEEQKNYYLPRLARGEDIPCFALTGPEAGSDAGSMPDTGVVCKGEYKGEKEVLGIRLNWEKRYITLGPLATLLGLAFKMHDPDHLLGEREDLGITLALIPTDIPGITIGARHFPLDSAFQVGPNYGKDVFIPLDQIIGGPERAGQGWRMLMDCLAEGRSISLPALSTGSTKLASRVVGAYARIRRQFKISIGRFEGIEEALARIAVHTYVADAAREVTSCAVDRGEQPSVLSAIVKYNLTERARQAINDAMDIQGGAAICLGPRNLIGRVYQSMPISITVEGANILTRSLITFGQGAIRCHPFLLKEMRAVADEDREAGAQEFDRALFGHIGFTISNTIRSLILGLTSGWGGKDESSYYRSLTRLSSAFALLADVSLLVLGGTLKRREMLSGRLADILSNLYLASTVLKRFQDDGSPKEDIPLLRWACDDALYTIQERMDTLLRNFPSRPAAFLLRRIIFPLGRSYAPPGDRLTHDVAKLLLSPSDARDRLTAGIYIPENTGEALGRIEDALRKVIAAETVENKIKEALQQGTIKKIAGERLEEEALRRDIITEDEAGLLTAASEARKEVITVDDFPAGEWGRYEEEN